MICHSGVGLTPTIDGRVHHFSAAGLYNGLVLMADDETGTYWDHVTGEAVHGPLRGKVLDAWCTPITNVAAALQDYPEIEVSISKLSLKGRLMMWSASWWKREKSVLPPFFRKTMGDADGRLPEHTHGLGVVVDGETRFYPMSRIGGGIEDAWGERVLSVSIDSRDGIPQAVWADGSRPMQLFSRWYGFAYTYRGCGIYGQDAS